MKVRLYLVILFCLKIGDPKSDKNTNRAITKYTGDNKTTKGRAIAKSNNRLTILPHPLKAVWLTATTGMDDLNNSTSIFPTKSSVFPGINRFVEHIRGLRCFCSGYYISRPG